jgi:hypothetical protein
MLEACDQVDTYGMGHYRQRLEADDERCERYKEKAFCLNHDSGRGASPERGGYAYFKRSDSRPWSYGHKWDFEDKLHQGWHEAGILRRHFDLPEDTQEP